MAKAEGLLPKFLHFQTKIKYTEDHNIEVQLENVTDHDWVEVVMCKDCIHAGDRDCPIDWPKNWEDYCSFGERREPNDRWTEEDLPAGD